MGEEKEKKTPEPVSFLDRSTEWAKKNVKLLRGGALFVIGFFLVLKTYMVFLHVALTLVGSALMMYGLYELKFTPLPKVMLGWYDKIMRR